MRSYVVRGLWLVVPMAIAWNLVALDPEGARAEPDLDPSPQWTFGEPVGEPSEPTAPAARTAVAPAVATVGGTLPLFASSRPTDLASGPRTEPAEDYDPWEPFNERTFEFNRQLDRLVIKPAAIGWSKTVPFEMRRGVENAFRNLGMPRRFLNSVLQLKFEGALRELTRFVMNSTIGVAGLFDVAGTAGVEASNEDAGQTLAVYGTGPGPYLVLPFFPPTTVRDAVGFGIDFATDPLSLVMPLASRLGTQVGATVNTRSLNLEVFEEVEESVLDLYSAVRNGYLQRRRLEIAE